MWQKDEAFGGKVLSENSPVSLWTADMSNIHSWVCDTAVGELFCLSSHIKITMQLSSLCGRAVGIPVTCQLKNFSTALPSPFCAIPRDKACQGKDQGPEVPDSGFQEGVTKHLPHKNDLVIDTFLLLLLPLFRCFPQICWMEVTWEGGLGKF